MISIVAPSVATTGTTLVLDLTAAPSSNPGNLPTSFTWTVDPSSAGIYLNAGGYGTGSGTLTLRYTKVVHGQGVRATGGLHLKINGLINTGGVFNDLGVVGDIPNRP